jgi:hypothetical protein
MRILLSLLALLVPRSERPRWREEWRAELRHGHRRMILGALPDAWTMRRLHRTPRRSGLFRGVGHDLRYGMRTLAAAPGFVLGVVLSLTLGIGGNIAAFTFINAAVFRPFPGVQDQHELARIRVEATRADSPMPSSFLSAAALTAADGLALLRSSLTTLNALSAHVDRDLVMSIDGRPVTGPGAIVSSNYFDVLGVRPAAGRFFSPADDRPGAEPIAVISHAVWQRSFAGRPAAIGSTMTVNGTTVHVVGVAAEGFVGVRKSDHRTEVWIPLGLAGLALRDAAGRPVHWQTARNLYVDLVGRRMPGSGRAASRTAAAQRPA